MKIEIQSDTISTRSGTSAAGKPYSIRSQQGWLHTAAAPYPSCLEINLEDNQPPHSPGYYEIDENSYFIDKYRRLTVGRLKLIPLASHGAAKPSRVA